MKLCWVLVTGQLCAADCFSQTTDVPLEVPDLSEACITSLESRCYLVIYRRTIWGFGLGFCFFFYLNVSGFVCFPNGPPSINLFMEGKSQSIPICNLVPGS